MKKENWRTWLKAAVIRAVKTAAQTAVSLIGTTAMIGSVNWVQVASAAGLSAIVSILLSIKGLPEVEGTTGIVWLKAAGMRALKTMAEAASGSIGSCLTIGSVDWRVVVSVTLLAGVLSLLTSLAGLPEVDSENAADAQ